MKCPHCGITTEELEVGDCFSQEKCPSCGWVSEVYHTYGDDDDPAYMIYDESEVAK